MFAGSVLELKDFEACSQLWCLRPPRHGKSVIGINSLVDHEELAACGMAAASHMPTFFISNNTVPHQHCRLFLWYWGGGADSIRKAMLLNWTGSMCCLSLFLEGTVIRFLKMWTADEIRGRNKKRDIWGQFLPSGRKHIMLLILPETVRDDTWRYAKTADSEIFLNGFLFPV